MGCPLFFLPSIYFHVMEKLITISKGTGRGDTKIAAFDAALHDAGISNYNLIRLSSIIPPNSKIELRKPDAKPEEFGHKLYVVYACQIENEIGKEAWSGIGWVLANDGSGKGLFVEHEGHSEQEVTNLINESLSAMVTYRPEEYGPVNQVVTGLSCDNQVVCALVAAVYQAKGWD